jgi:zinc protease
MNTRSATLFPVALLVGCVLFSSVFAVEVQVETYTLPNGITVTLHEDHSLPTVTINTWFAVGSKDEDEGRSGFAHMFEHLMFMGTHRVPDNSFDVIMESGGGANNASTSVDRTNYYSWGPVELLPTLLWLDADRLADLGEAMTQEKLDLQRDVVRNERRQGVENTPYGIAEEIIPDALYPAGHPYHHTVIGTHEDLEAATLDDVKRFFSTHYVPGNASLVVAGDFDSAAVKKVIAASFGAIPARTVPPHISMEPASLDREVRRVTVDKVQFPKIYLVWHSPALFTDGDADMDLISGLLSDGDSSRLQQRLVIDLQLAQEVVAFQYSKQLGSEFRVEIVAAPGADLERIKRETLKVIAELAAEGPGDTELSRVVAANESRFLRGMESLASRADSINRYRHYLGVADGFALDMERYTTVSVQSVQKWAGKVFGEGRLDLRVLPVDAAVEGADLDQRPEPFPAGQFQPPVPEHFALSNGLQVSALARPGTGLFAAELMADGGSLQMVPDKAGVSTLAASLLTAGADGKNAGEFAEAVALLGANIRANAGTRSFSVSVTGISSRIEPTLDLFADAILRANLAQDDFDREKKLQLASISSRTDDPITLARLGSRYLLFDEGDARGRPVSGYLHTVESLTSDDVRNALSGLMNPGNSRLVVVGDFRTADLRKMLETRFGKWKTKMQAAISAPEPVGQAAPGRLVLLDRPDAPQTVVWILRPIPAADDAARAVQESLNVLFGGSFTSRLNQNLREKHGYTYGAGSYFLQEMDQHLLFSASRIQTDVTGPALTEYRGEFNRLATGDVTAAELSKAVKTARQEVVGSVGTTGSILGLFTGLASQGRPLDDTAGYLKSLDGVTLETANEAARSGLYDWDKLLVLLVGDGKVILPQLKEAGFPEPEIFEAENLQ